MYPGAEDISHKGRRWLDRRAFLADSAHGLGAIALASLLGGDRPARRRFG